MGKGRPYNNACDYGHEVSGAGQVRRLDTGGGSGAYLCREHWKKEMEWRKERNRTLTGSARFPIRKFPGKGGRQ